MEREPNTIYVLSLSYGKDSLACLGAIDKLGLPLDRIVHAEVWATETIPADLPPMVEFKAKADKIIKERYGIEVEHIWATKKVADGGGRLSYDGVFHRRATTAKHGEHIYGFPKQQGAWCTGKLKQDLLAETNLRRYILQSVETSGGGGGTYKQYGFPMRQGQWCNNLLKVNALNYGVRKPLGSILHRGTQSQRKEFSPSPSTMGGINIVQYLGIAADEPERIARHEKKKGIMLPLVMAGWDEAFCRKWCEERDLLSPIYTTATRGGCWFCHNQGVDQLRQLRRNYPDLWALLMKWDLDSPTTFKADGHTVHDYDKRFEMEDKGIIKADEQFFWKYLQEPPKRQPTLFDIMGEDYGNS